MYWTYVLKSQSSGVFYVGYTSDLKMRLKQHNSGRGKFTRTKGPWELFHTEKFHEETDAVKRERQIKGWKSRAAIERLKF